jgi:esterase/lipase
LIKRILSSLAVVTILVTFGVGVYHLFRIRLPKKLRLPRPTANYAEAFARLKLLQAQDGERVNPRCRTLLLDHGRRTNQVTVLLHGFTNCPYQFMELAQQLHAAGHTVLIPRFPHHGLDPMADDQGRLTVEELVTLADEAVDIACGLGENVTVCGLSLGGALSTWIAQNRPEVARVVALSPALSIQLVPSGWGRALCNLLDIAPNFFGWWDRSLHEPLPGREHQYPRFASHGVATILRLGQIVAYQAQRTKPAAGSILIVNNPADEVVDRSFTAEIVAAWREQHATVEIYDLPGELSLPHDYIDPTQPDQQVKNIYPQILTLLVEGDLPN